MHIPVKDFLRRIGGALNRYFEVSHSPVPCSPPSLIAAIIQDNCKRAERELLDCYHPWRIGRDGGITRDDVLIIGVVHVSDGSLQP